MGQIYLSKQQSAPFHLALEALLHETGSAKQTPSALIYTHRPAIVYGRGQNPYREVDWIRAAEEKILLYRRISGGGAVYHDEGVLNWAFFVPRRQALVLNYAHFLAPLRAVLARLGLESEIRRKSNLYVQGKKISGNAQALGAEVIMCHGSLLFCAETRTLERLLHGPRAEVDRVAVPSDIAEVTNLKTLLNERGHDLSLAAFQELYLEELATRGLGGETFARAPLPPALVARVKEEYEPRFLSASWNAARTAPFRLRLVTPEAVRLLLGQHFPAAWQLQIARGTIVCCVPDGEGRGEEVSAFAAALEGCPLAYEPLKEAIGRVFPETVALWLPAFSS